MNGLRLHHVGYLVNSIEPAVARYIQRYGYVAVTGIIHDPQQTALVQFLKLPGDASSLEFIAPDGPTSRLAPEAARNTRPLHHLCFRCIDLMVAIERLRQQGMMLFAEPVPASALGSRRIAWLMGSDRLPIELLEARGENDDCAPGQADDGPL